MKGILASLASGCLSIAFLIGWLFYGVNGAHNAAVFLVWFDGFMGLIALIACFALSPGEPKRIGFLRRAMNAAVNGAVLGLLIWFGQFLLTGVTLFSLVSFALYRSVARLHAEKLSADAMLAARSKS
jgi:hypothetical protein